MKFSEKLNNMRIAKGLTQSELSEKIGVSIRSIYKYEAEQAAPRRKIVFANLSDVFGTPIDFWKNDSDNDFELMTEYLYGDYGKNEAERIVREVRGLFTGGKISEEDKDALMKTLQDVYWETKKIEKKQDV